MIHEHNTACKTTPKVTQLVRRASESCTLIPRILSSMQSILEYILAFLNIYIYIYMYIYIYIYFNEAEIL